MIEKTKKLSNHDLHKIKQQSKNVWIFGYGSITWKPEFGFEDSVVGHIKGFARRFWQGSISHRGNPEMPGRVVTLIEEQEEKVWGIAFKVPQSNFDKALMNLNTRECTLGGYEIFGVQFFPDGCSNSFFAVVYVATPESHLFLGPDTPEGLAMQIANSSGHCGHNIEYLFRLADFMREKAPHADDEHLFTIEKLVRKLLGLSTDKILPWTELVSNNDDQRRWHKALSQTTRDDSLTCVTRACKLQG